MQSRLRELATALAHELEPIGGPRLANHERPPPTDSSSLAVDDADVNPLDQFCSSIDALRGTEIDQTIPPGSGWSARPTRSSGVAAAAAGGGDASSASSSSAVDRDEVLRLCRRGIPPALRCAAWIVNVASASNPDLSASDRDDYGTLRKVRVIDHGWDLTLKSIFPDASDLERADVLDFGVGNDHLMNIMLRDHGGAPIPDGGIKSLTKVLHAARDSLGLEYCPLLPDVVCLLLSYMPESYVYATIRQMVADDSSFFLAISRVQHLTWCKTFGDLMKRCFPQTAAAMEQIGALTPIGLEPILKRFFVPLLRRKHVFRIMDIFTGEGAHAIFRIGTTLCCLAHAHLGDSIRENCDNAAIFWEGVRLFAHSKHFRFDIFLDHQAYGVQKRIFTRPIFPRRDFVTRLISNNEAWAEENQVNISLHHERRPLGLVEGKYPIVLAKNSPERLRLAQWLPPSLQSTKLDLIYSSNHHGRSVEMFYLRCASAIHTVTVLEVLGTDAVIGMYATQTWHNDPDGYGDGECFLFRLKPNTEVFRYKVGAGPMDLSSRDEGEENVTGLDDAGQLMISGATFISMGVGKGGASGLRLNEDLTRGSTSKSIGFDNEGLIAEGVEVFEVGLGMSCSMKSIHQNVMSQMIRVCFFFSILPQLRYTGSSVRLMASL
ncbi:hypothetical protein ACHAWF_003230 [Thalassiosira exigua]